MIEFKQCSICGKEKPFDCFGKHVRMRYGLRSACKECERKVYPYIKRTDADKARDRRNESSKRLDLTDRVIKQMIWRELKKIGQVIAFKDMTEEMVEEKKQSVIEYRSRPEKDPPSCKVWFKECEICGDLFTVRMPSAKYCSDECKYEGFKAYQRERYEQNWIPPESFKCKECGELYQPEFGDKKTVFCSDRCQKRYRGKAYGKDIRKKARYFNIEYQPINVFKVFRRDNWHCQICGKPTPKKNRGTCYTNAPELDHRIPMSKGGGHLYSNVQCVCRKCNGQKSNKDNRGQIPLFEVAVVAG